MSVAVSQLKQDVRIIALDTQGKVFCRSAIGDQSINTLDQITLQFAALPDQRDPRRDPPVPVDRIQRCRAEASEVTKL